jgi:hypothetical protein
VPKVVKQVFLTCLNAALKPSENSDFLLKKIENPVPPGTGFRVWDGSGTGLGSGKFFRDEI